MRFMGWEKLSRAARFPSSCCAPPSLLVAVVSRHKQGLHRLYFTCHRRIRWEAIFCCSKGPLHFCQLLLITSCGACVYTQQQRKTLRTRTGGSNLIGALCTSNHRPRSVSDLRANRVVVSRQPSHKPPRPRLVATRACSLRAFPTSSILIPSNCPLLPPPRRSRIQLEAAVPFLLECWLTVRTGN